MHIAERLEFTVDPSVVWMRASDVEKMPSYWHGTKSLEVIERRGGTVLAKARFAFGGAGKVEISTGEERERTVRIRYLSGPFKGTQAIKVNDSSIEATWDIEFTGIFRLSSGWNEKHFRSGTVHALERLVAPARA